MSIRPGQTDFEVALGGSVAIDGTCLTLEKWTGSEMCFSAVAETLDRTTLADARTGRTVNLERAALIGGRLDGHFVYGHVDATGTILRDREMDGRLVRHFSVSPELAVFIAEKGSVAIDGISLTVASCRDGEFAVSFIPHTLRATTMAFKKTGDAVNLECDVVARYLYRFMQGGGETARPSRLLSLMERSGF